GAARRPSARSSPAPSTAWRKRSGWTNPTMAEPDAVPEVHTLLIDQRRRGQRGESPELDDYRTRFPDLAEALGDLFEVHRAIESSPEVSTAPVFERSAVPRSEEHTSELQSHHDLVCR